MLDFAVPGLVGPTPTVGRIIERVDSHAKMLEVQWDDGITLRTQMRFSGTWHLYRTGERWRKPTHQVRASIEVAQWVAVCFNAPIVETFRQFDRHRHPGSGGLGPNVCNPNADLADCALRICSYRPTGTPIGEVVVDERVMRGVGNVFRSELLWATELSPWAEVGDISFEDSNQIVNAVHRLLGSSVGTTAAFESDDHLNVYGRNGQRCGRCGDTIEVVRIGELNRLMYWCPGCQVAPGERVARAIPSIEARATQHPAEELFMSELRRRRLRSFTPNFA